MILVVGANGFLGQAITAQARASTLKICTASHTDGADYHFDLGKNPSAFVGEIPATVSHAIICSGYSSIDGCFEDPAHSRRINVTGTLKLLQALNNSDIVPVFCSSDMVFDGAHGGYDETEHPEPATVYGSQKREVEDWLAASGAPHLILRLTKLYDLSKQDRSFLGHAYRTIAAKKPVKAAIDQTVQPTLVGEAASAILRLIEMSARGTFHLAAPETRSWFEIANIIQDLLGAEGLVEASSIQDFDLKEPRATFSTLDVSKFRSATGVELTGIGEALPNLIRRRIS